MSRGKHCNRQPAFTARCELVNATKTVGWIALGLLDAGPLRLNPKVLQRLLKILGTGNLSGKLLGSYFHESEAVLLIPPIQLHISIPRYSEIDKIHIMALNKTGVGRKTEKPRTTSGKAAGATSRKSMGVDRKMSKTFELKCYEVFIGQN